MTDPTVRSGYSEIANRRRTIPAEVALAMLDKNLELLKVETEVSPEFVLKGDLETLKQKHTIQSQKVLSPPGQFALFTGSEARSEGFAKYLAADRAGPRTVGTRQGTGGRPVAVGRLASGRSGARGADYLGNRLARATDD